MSSEILNPVGDEPLSTKMKAAVRDAFRSCVIESAPTSKTSYVSYLSYAECWQNVKSEEVTRQIKRLASVMHEHEDWKGYKCSAPNKASIERAIDTLLTIRNLPFKVPLASLNNEGTANFFWNDGRLYADVEITENGKVEYRVRIDGKVIDDEEDLPANALPRRLSGILAKAYLRQND